MATTFRPTCRVTILDTPGNTAKDDNGDPVEDGVVVVASGLPAVWGQKDERGYDPVEQRVTRIRGFEVRLRPGVVVVEGQRMRNEKTEQIGYVKTVNHESTIGVAGDVLVRLISIEN